MKKLYPFDFTFLKSNPSSLFKLYPLKAVVNSWQLILNIFLINLFPKILRARLHPLVSKDPPLANLEPSTKGFFSNSLIPENTIKINKELTLKELSRLQDKIEKELNNLKKSFFIAEDTQNPDFRFVMILGDIL